MPGLQWEPLLGLLFHSFCLWVSAPWWTILEVFPDRSPATGPRTEPQKPYFVKVFINLYLTC